MSAVAVLRYYIMQMYCMYNVNVVLQLSQFPRFCYHYFLKLLRILSSFSSCRTDFRAHVAVHNKLLQVQQQQQQQYTRTRQYIHAVEMYRLTDSMSVWQPCCHDIDRLTTATALYVMLLYCQGLYCQQFIPMPTLHYDMLGCKLI